MDRDRLRELADWPALGLPLGTLDAGVPLDERDLERLQAARAFVAAEPPRPQEALAALKPLLTERKYDIRGMAVLLQAVAVERPVVGAAAVLDRLATLLAEEWEALGPTPEDKRRKLASVAFAAAIDQLRVALSAAIQSGRVEKDLVAWPEGREPDIWNALCDGLAAAARDRQLESVLAKIAEVRTACHPLLRQPEPIGSEAEHEADGGPGSPSAEPDPGPRTAIRNSGAEVSLRASPHFFDLLEKLRAFETLLDRNDCGKAAIVAQDIEQTIASFDVRLFFPELFAGFFEGMVGCADQLTAFQGELDAPSWRALGQLYRVDLAAFLRAGDKSRAAGRARD